MLNALGAETRGFVPTMGNLHQGHLSLLKKCLDENQIAILSIFVNPTQFGPKEDFASYPRTLEQDCKLAKDILATYPAEYEKQLIIYAPDSPEDIYPSGFQTSIHISPLNSILEGHFRPNHFNGMATVVFLLFQIVRSHRAYFGQKDLQQLIIIKKMVHDLLIPVEIVGMPTIRDIDGLALSSRNQYLSPTERDKALTLPKTLDSIKEMFHNKATLSQMNAYIESTLQQDKNWNYLSMRSLEDLSVIESLPQKVAVVATYQVGKVRLLDNLILEKLL